MEGINMGISSRSIYRDRHNGVSVSENGESRSKDNEDRSEPLHLSRRNKNANGNDGKNTPSMVQRESGKAGAGGGAAEEINMEFIYQTALVFFLSFICSVSALFILDYVLFTAKF
jgi:hypothetical protein